MPARPSRARWALVPAVAALLVSLPAAAHADVYWATGGKTVGEGTLAGAVVTQARVTGAVGLYQDTAVGSDHLYWANYAGASISRSALDGTGVQDAFVPTAPDNPVSVAVDRTHVYWSTLSGRLGRADLDGSHVVANFIAPGAEKRSLVVTENFLYWAEPDLNRISRATLDGATVVQNFITGAAKPMGLAASGQYLYWTNSTSKSIGRANLAGTTVTQTYLAGIAATPEDVAVDAGHLYWSIPSTSHIGRVNLRGAGMRSDTWLAAATPHGIAVVPVPTVSGPTVVSGPTTGGTKVTVAGTGLWRASTVTFGGVPAAFTVASDTSLVATLPAHAKGSVSVAVSTPGGTASGTTAFTYLPVAQTPKAGCVTAPKALPLKGTRRLVKAGCLTTAGKRPAVTVTRSSKAHKSSYYYKVTRAKTGAVMIRTKGHHVRLRITWTSPATSTYRAYVRVVTYRV